MDIQQVHVTCTVVLNDLEMKLIGKALTGKLHPSEREQAATLAVRFLEGQGRLHRERLVALTRFADTAKNEEALGAAEAAEGNLI